MVSHGVDLTSTCWTEETGMTMNGLSPGFRTDSGSPLSTLDIGHYQGPVDDGWQRPCSKIVMARPQDTESSQISVKGCPEHVGFLWFEGKFS